MQKTIKKRPTRDLLAKLGLGGLALAFALSSPAAFAQQNPSNSDAGAPQTQDQNPAQQDPNVNPSQDQAATQDQTTAPQDQDNSGNQGPMNAPQQQDQQNQGQTNPSAHNGDVRAPRPVAPPSLTIPGGSIIQIRTTDFLSSDKNQKGNTFIATLAQPIVIDGWVVMRRGQTITGQVTDAAKAGRVKGVSRLQLELNQLTLVDGQLVLIQTQLLNATAGTSNGRDAAAIGLTTGTGAAIGAAAAGGPGAAIGAGAGFVASVAGVLLTRGKPTIIVPETLLTFKIEQPVSFTTVRAQMAFRPVTQSDYQPAPQRRVATYRRAYPYPPPPPYAYYGPGFYYGYPGYGW